MIATRLLACLAVAGAPATTFAQVTTFAQATTEPEPCAGLVSSRPSLVRPAALGTRIAATGEVAITFVGHSTFLIESPGGVKIATDYNDYVRPRVVPDIATMNRAHTTHFSQAPDPSIRHVLRGWGGSTGPARHDLTFGDVQVRNVATNIRDYGGSTEYGGNSIFVFETGGLCIAHLGHLHHTLEPSHLKNLGRIDVVLVPVDGGYTLDTAGMMEVLRAINAPLMLPMHHFNSSTLERFVTLAKEFWPVETRTSPQLTVSRTTLPRSPTVIVLPGR